MSQKPPGRFIEFDSLSSDWKVITHKRAVEKASQALREGNTKSCWRSLKDIGKNDTLAKKEVNPQRVSKEKSQPNFS